MNAKVGIDKIVWCR